MTITRTFSAPFFTGTGSAAAVDIIGRYDVALAGRAFMLDTRISPYTGHAEFMHQSVPIIRNQADQSSSPSEASINPNDLWRRSADTWHKGAGQTVLDRADSDPARFNASKGVNVWERWQLSLLPDTGQKHTSSNTNVALVVVGGFLYYADGQTLRRTADITPGSPTWTSITGTDASTISSMASDGYNLWLAQAGGVFATTRGAATAASYNALVCTLLRYVKGRLMAANANVIYNITSGSTPSALLTHPNTDFVWVDFAEGQGQIYAAGFSGDKSIIYKTAIKADGTALDIPTVAGELPDGEIVRAIQGYLGFLLIGTDKGVRFAAADASGNLTIGSLIPTGAAVRCFEPQDRFCWYGLTNLDGGSTGLGRLDLSILTAPLTPAYASDLMASTQGAVLSAVTFQGIRVFTVSAHGVYAELTTLVASGHLDSGQITYRLPDDKRAMFLDIRHDGTGSHTPAVAKNGGMFTTLDTHTVSSEPFAVGQVLGNRFEVRITLATVATVGPVIRSMTLRSYPVVSTVQMIIAPLMLAEALTLHDGSEAVRTPTEDLAFITALRDDHTLVLWQEGNQGYSGIVEDYEWRPTHLTKDNKYWNGTCLVTMKIIS